MKLDPTDILHVAKLARLELTEAEVTQYTEELSVVFEYFDMLDEVDVDSVEETTQVTGLMNVVREDVPVEISKETRKDLIQAFPQKNGELLAVKAVFTEN